MKLDLSQIITEGRNPASQNIDELSTEAMLRVINDEDKKVALAVEAIVPQIAAAVDAICAAFQAGGRRFIAAQAPPVGWAYWMPANAHLPLAHPASRLSA